MHYPYCSAPVLPRVDSRGASVTAGLFIDPLDGARPQVAPRRRHDFLRAAPARALVVGVAVLPGEPGNDNDSIYANYSAERLSCSGWSLSCAIYGRSAQLPTPAR